MNDDMRDVPHARGFAPWKFLAVFLLVFFLISVFLYAIDFVPEAPKENSGGASAALADSASSIAPLPPAGVPENPIRIAAPSVGIDIPIENPSSSDNAVLDDALLKGAVRYPGSSFLGEDSRMYIFGHQSYLPVVHNRAFKAFNGLQDLKAGDEIVVYSATAAYRYRVAALDHTNTAAGVVALGGHDGALTLSTCDVFGAKSDRWEVVAQFVSREPLGAPAS